MYNRIQKNTHQFEKCPVHTGLDSERCAPLCTYCENNLPNQAFCERTNAMLHELQHDKGTRKTGKVQIKIQFLW